MRYEGFISSIGEKLDAMLKQFGDENRDIVSVTYLGESDQVLIVTRQGGRRSRWEEDESEENDE